MRILHALSQTELTGSEVYAWELCRDQDQRGHAVHVVSDRLHKQFPGQRLTLALSTASPWTRLRNILKLRKYLREQGIEIVHCHSRGACRHLFWATRGLGIPIMTTLHGRQHTSFSKRLFDIYGDLVVAICENIAQQLKQGFQMDAHKIEIIRNPVTPLEVSQAPARPRVALMGRASGPKGERLTALLRSQAEAWLKHDPQLEIEIVLSGLTEPLRRELRERFPERVQIIGSVPSLAEVLGRCSVVVASGRIAVEALLAGRQVIALGESSCLGRVTCENLKSILASNFGDVGENQPVDHAMVTHHLLAALAVRAPDEKLRRLVEKEFHREVICRRIEDLYRGLRLFKKSPWIPILMYHKVVRDPIPTQHRTFVLAKNFAQHLRFFRQRGFSFLHFSDLADFWYERRPLKEFPKRPVILTFDDGYRNNQELAVPLLEKFKAKATIFALSDPAVTFNEWDEREGEPREDLMSFQDLRGLPSQLIEIGSHGFRHERLTQKQDGEVLVELRDSRERLHRELSRPVGVFAYAYGDIDGRLPLLAEQAGYDFAVNTDSGPVVWIKNRWSLFRVNIFPEDNWLSLWKKTSPWYRRYYFRKRGR